MADEWLAGIGGGLDALAQVLQRRKLEKLQAAAVAEQIRQFNVQAEERARQHQADEAERLRWHTLQQDTQTAARERATQQRTDLATERRLEGGAPPAEQVSPEFVKRVQDVGGEGFLRSFPATPGDPRLAVTTPEPGATGLSALPGRLVAPGYQQPQTAFLGGAQFQEHRRAAGERAAAAAEAARVHGQQQSELESQRATNRQEFAQLAAGLRPAPAPHAPVRVHGIDENGNPTEKFVTPEQAMAGGPFRTPPNAPTMSRAFLAKTALQTGYDIIRETQDPTVRAQLGVLAGRYNSLRELIGNPPKEFPKVIGTIMSFAKANQGIHGQRSEEGAQHMERFLSARLEPEALANAVRGINNFGRHFLENVGMKAPEEPEAAAPHIPTYNRATRKFE